MVGQVLKSVLCIGLLTAMAGCGSLEEIPDEDMFGNEIPAKREPQRQTAERFPPQQPTSSSSQQTSGRSASIDDEDDGLGFTDILPFFGDKKEDPVEAGGAAPVLGVNNFLWRATLDTLSFMPLSSADPVGGVVITDWYADPSNPEERFKVTVYILDQRLRADGLRVSAFKQVQDSGDWRDSPIDKTTVADLENAILTRARQLRVAGLQ